MAVNARIRSEQNTDGLSSKLYKLNTLISQNDLCQSWLATCTETGEQCFIKTLSTTGSLDIGVGRSILTDSYICQRSLRIDRILRASRRRTENGIIFLEYPYLDRTVWRELSIELFRKHFFSLVTQICSIVDYVHDLDLVHCDLKLGNFLINESTDVPTVLLVDLDFLCRANTKPKGWVFGTPEHIAPEILANERVVIQSDNYSLGVSLKKVVQHSKRASELSATVLGQVTELAESLIRPDYLHRPRFLIDALFKHGIISEQDCQAEKKKLLARLLLTRLSGYSKKNLNTDQGLKKFLREDNRVLGLHDDLITFLSLQYAGDRTAAMSSFKSLLAAATVEKQVDYWHLSLSDETLWQVYSSQVRRSDPDVLLTGDDNRSRPDDTYGTLCTVRQLCKQGLVEQPYVLLKHHLEHMRKDDSDAATSALTPVLAELASLASCLNRPNVSEQYLTELNDLHKNLPCSRAPMICELILLNCQLGQLDVAHELVATGMHDMFDTQVNRYSLTLQRMKAWILIRQGKYQEAQEILTPAAESANRLKLFDMVVLIMYSEGVLHLMKGEFPLAEQILTRCVNTAREKRIASESASAISLLAWLHYAFAEYDKAVKYGKLAARIARDPQHVESLLTAYQALTLAFIRLSEFNKAEYWQQRYLSLGGPENNKSFLGTYYVVDGFLEANRYDLVRAADSLYKALALVEQDVIPNVAGKAHHNLAEVALLRGDIDLCREHVEKAKELFKRIKDGSSLAELDLITQLTDVCYNKESKITELIAQTQILVENNCRYYAGLAAFHALLNCQDGQRPQIIATIRPIAGQVGRSDTPLFAAISLVLDWIDGNDTDRTTEVTVWKECFRVLLDGKNSFLSALVALKIASLYAQMSMIKHAQKFLLQGQRLAESLSNRFLTEKAQSELEHLSRVADNQERLIDSFHGVSEVLQGIGDYKESTHRLIQFAVDQTGAERGVLLLRTMGSKELRVGEAVNCDDSSLSDIVDFSRTVALDTSMQSQALLINNAVCDKRTNQYQSILYHNILSIVCVPLSDDDESLGVLYLDHHTIPSLFEEDDFTYIKSIANFIAVTLKTLHDYRSLDITNTQLIRDLNRLGDRHSFITRDASMLELLEKLPQISRTDASVLILGESGTGKEILCHLIHKLGLRADKPLVKLNCAAIPSTMIESELFGIANNTATGVDGREGRFVAADKGTLYIDEIGDMPLETQAKVLRVLEYQQFEKVGTVRSIHTDIRFIYATNKSLIRLVKQEKFREDLFYRINTITIEVPPLRKRPDDIPLLVEHFVKIFSTGKRKPRFTGEAMDLLVAYEWPGNVRELKNLVERCCILHAGAKLSVEMLPAEIQHVSSKTTRTQNTLSIEARRIRDALTKTDWNQSRAARQLGISISSLRRKVNKYDLKKTL